VLTKTPSWIPYLSRKSWFRLKGSGKVVYLTFDDGPVPGVTDWVLDQLKQFNARGSFFVLGKQVANHPELFQRIIDEGHAIGNHSYSHPNGWKTPFKEYVENFAKAKAFVQSSLARPPYGRITWKQLRHLSKEHTMVFWDVLAGDFIPDIGSEKVVQRVCNNVRPGSIVVLHDSLKAESNLKGALPIIIEKLQTLGYEFRALPHPDSH